MCSINEAFQSSFVMGGGDSGGFTRAEDDTKRHKKRRKAILPPEPAVIEPDRPANRPLAAAELLTGNTTTPESAILNAYDVDNSGYFPHPTTDSRDENVYKLDPDWATVFNSVQTPIWIKERIQPEKEKPKESPTPIDGQSTLWQSIQSPVTGTTGTTGTQIADLQRRLDSMFAKLDELEQSRSQSAHLEILMFILGGLLLIFILDIFVKQGTRIAIMLSNHVATMTTNVAIRN